MTIMADEVAIDQRLENTVKPDIQVKLVPTADVTLSTRWKGNDRLALLLLAAALVVIFGTGAYWLCYQKAPGYTGWGRGVCRRTPVARVVGRSTNLDYG
jgi:hypothetical protein